MRGISVPGYRLLTVACAAVLTTTLLTAGSAQSQQAPESPWKISGYMFGDYYFVAKHHVDTIDGMHGFWFRRIYFTYDHKLDAGFSTRFRLEMNSPGDFKSSFTLNPYIKDAYLQYAKGKQKVLFGIISTPTWDNLETMLGYRPVEKTPLDLYKMGSSRDFGVGLKGSFGEGDKASYMVLVGNGSGNKAETDKGKALYGNFVYKINSNVSVEGYFDVTDKPGDTNWMTEQVILYFLTDKFRASLLYAHQNRQVPGKDDFTLDVVSVYGDAKIGSRARIFGRIDKVSDPIPDGDKIDYLVLANNAKPTFGMAGVTLDLAKGIQLIPNIEFVNYSDPVSGTKPDNDVIGKVTLYFSWK